MYNLREYSLSYYDTTSSSWLYSKHKAANFNASITNNHDFKSFKYKTILMVNTVAQPTPNVADGIQLPF